MPDELGNVEWRGHALLRSAAPSADNSQLRRRLEQLDVELDLDDVAEGDGAHAGRHRDVDAEVLAAQLTGRLEAGVARPARELLDAAELEIEPLRAGDVADRQVAVDDPAVAGCR